MEAFQPIRADFCSWHDEGMANDAKSEKNPTAVAPGRLGRLQE
jgi:hypothetical protein